MIRVLGPTCDRSHDNRFALKRHTAASRANPGRATWMKNRAPARPRGGCCGRADDQVVKIIWRQADRRAWGTLNCTSVPAVRRVLDPRIVAPDRSPAAVRGWGSRSARHHRRTRRNEPRGVAPSPSRLLAAIPERPSATGIRSDPIASQPRVRAPGRPATRITAIWPRMPRCREPILLVSRSSPTCSFAPAWSIAR